MLTARAFARFARREKGDDERLCEAADRAERGLVDADLGGGLIKLLAVVRSEGLDAIA